MIHTKEQWEKIGLLDTLPKERKDMAVKAFNAAIKFLTENETEEHKPFETVGFPVLIRIIREVDLSAEEVPQILQEVAVAMEEYDYNKFNGFYSIDVEMEFVVEFSEKKIEELKNRK